MGDSGQLSSNVRNWLHYDNLASSFYKQANRARQIKDDFEDKIIGELKAKNMENAVIQINNGRLNVVEERNPKTLSLLRIEELLHSYFNRRGVKDETKDILSFIKTNRGVDIAKKLKKTGGQALPPLPGPPPMSGVSGAGPLPPLPPL
jgi:hypothetical protein